MVTDGRKGWVGHCLKLDLFLKLYAFVLTFYIRIHFIFISSHSFSVFSALAAVLGTEMKFVSQQSTET